MADEVIKDNMHGSSSTFTKEKPLAGIWNIKNTTSSVLRIPWGSSRILRGSAQHVTPCHVPTELTNLLLVHEDSTSK
jgi:hypothetical protein